MEYQNQIREAVFYKRPNRFLAEVELDGERELVHVKNTGRCRELLQEGARVFLEESSNANRKTKHSLVAVYKGDMHRHQMPWRQKLWPKGRYRKSVK